MWSQFNVPTIGPIVARQLRSECTRERSDWISLEGVDDGVFTDAVIDMYVKRYASGITEEGDVVWKTANNNLIGKEYANSAYKLVFHRLSYKVHVNPLVVAECKKNPEKFAAEHLNQYRLYAVGETVTAEFEAAADRQCQRISTVLQHISSRSPNFYKFREVVPRFDLGALLSYWKNQSKHSDDPELFKGIDEENDPSNGALVIHTAASNVKDFKWDQEEQKFVSIEYDAPPPPKVLCFDNTGTPCSIGATAGMHLEIKSGADLVARAPGITHQSHQAHSIHGHNVLYTLRAVPRRAMREAASVDDLVSKMEGFEIDERTGECVLAANAGANVGDSKEEEVRDCSMDQNLDFQNQAPIRVTESWFREDSDGEFMEYDDDTFVGNADTYGMNDDDTEWLPPGLNME